MAGIPPCKKMAPPPHLPALLPSWLPNLLLPRVLRVADPPWWTSVVNHSAAQQMRGNHTAQNLVFLEEFLRLYVPICTSIFFQASTSRAPALAFRLPPFPTLISSPPLRVSLRFQSRDQKSPLLREKPTMTPQIATH